MKTSLNARFFIKAIEFMFLGINMFWARVILILARAARRGLKCVLGMRRPKTCPRLERKLFYYCYHFGGH